jgi:transcriptional regulator
MYVPDHFAERDPLVLQRWMREYAFALLVTMRDGAFEATHLPLWLDAGRGRYGTLLGHVARGNPQARCFDGETRGLAVFAGPHAYVSPRWYASPGVPTWNYLAVHAEGVLRPLDDAGRLRELLRQLTETHDGPGGFAALSQQMVERMSRGVLAFELPIETLTGKAKLSQNKNAADRVGVIAGLEGQGDPNGPAVAAMLRSVEPRA